ncbi:hypothetical protein A2645_01800 [Candidatus Nomurabacteria bacterium RIFCSPHIGHO2_01_FULL_39_9]|uniref:Uncharacterized protein n=1 Tax=Candidatus Nomurabacteria bacterium RIFCSPHIGHO2_01_FULL_39_9 TaxID=1801735 RepID=A0A1F6UVE7_9BACT|nr:MAG: hypothetical protein A2645_01800 [Candidatus Nomurabacteria bacterium RIFCSPHIGHO2_01_FULL_39_9]
MTIETATLEKKEKKPTADDLVEVLGTNVLTTNIDSSKEIERKRYDDEPGKVFYNLYINPAEVKNIQKFLEINSKSLKIDFRWMEANKVQVGVPEKNIEDKDAMTSEKKKILELGVVAARAAKTYDEAKGNLIARGLTESSEKLLHEEYFKKVENTNKELIDALNGLAKDSQEKMKEKIQAEERRLGLHKNPYSGEYSKPESS